MYCPYCPVSPPPPPAAGQTQDQRQKQRTSQVEEEMQDGKVVGLKYTFVDITLTTNNSKATGGSQAQYLPPLKRITVYADTVTILGHINLPSTNIRIVARQLLCAAGYGQCVINTSGTQNQTSLVANANPAQGGSKGTGFGASGNMGTDGAWAACRSLALSKPPLIDEVVHNLGHPRRLACS